MLWDQYRDGDCWRRREVTLAVADFQARYLTVADIWILLGKAC